MRIRRLAIVSGAVIAAMASAPTEARMGVDEETAGARSMSRSGGSSSGGSSSFRGFTWKSSDGNNKLIIGGRLQGRFDFISWDSASGRDDTATFELHRARLYLLGHVMNEDNKFFVQLGSDSPNPLWSPATSAHDFRLFDAWMKHVYSDGAAIKLGQFKTAFGRQNLTSSAKMQFADRSLAVQRLGVDRRDVGIELSGGLEGGIYQYALSITNGDGPNTLNLDDQLSFTGRFSVNPTGDYGYSEGAMASSEDLDSTFGVAVNFFSNETGMVNVDWLRFNIDGGIKKGDWSLQGEYFFTQIDPDGGSKLKNNAYYLQAGYFVKPERVELAARVSQMFPEGSDNEQTEISIGLNLLTFGHRLKWQAAYGLFDDKATDQTHHRIQAQGQLWF